MPRRTPRWPSIGLNSCSCSTRASSVLALGESSPALRPVASSLRDLDHQLFALRQELVQRRIDGADRDRLAVHRLEHAVEVLALQRQQLVERRAAIGLVVGEDHPLHDRDAPLAEEHVLGAAQADAARAERVGELAPDPAGRRWRARPGAGTCRPTTAAALKRSIDRRVLRLQLARDAPAGSRSAATPPCASFTSPVRPSNETKSPSLTVWSLIAQRAARARRSTSSPAPTTDGLPIWRPTTAACEVMPPVAVRTPCATHMPWMSSGTVSRRTRMTGLPCVRPRHRVVGREDDLAGRGAGRRRQPLGRDRKLRPLLRIEPRRQQLRQRFGIDQQHRLLRRDQLLLDQVGGDDDRGVAGALAAARLQHEQPLVLDRELEVLDVPVVLLEPRRDLAQLLVGLRHHLLELADRLRRADAGDDVLALRVDQELAVELLGAGRRVAREADAGRRAIAGVAEHHHLHVDGGADRVGDVVDAAVFLGARVVPRAEHGVARHAQLLGRILRERPSSSRSRTTSL